MRRKTQFAIVGFLLTLYILGCVSDELEGPLMGNRPPTVWLAIAPPEGSTVSYRAHIHWGGRDADGEVAYFEYAITDNETGLFDPADTTGADKWNRVVATDSVFIFTADVLDSSLVKPGVHQPYPFTRSHTFFIRSGDDQ